MENIEVKILNHNLDGTPLFLAKMTQRGSEITSMDDLLKLYFDNVEKTPSSKLLDLPHSTIFRMCNLTIAIYGLSTKAVSQLRTHATRLTFMSTSTQYSEFTKVEKPYVIPNGLTKEQEQMYIDACNDIHQGYIKLYESGLDRDKAGYLLPQSLKKCLIISGNFPAWQYMLSLRLCNRNTEEVQHICREILQQINDECGKTWADVCLPSCVDGQCKEGKFCCGKKYEDVRIQPEENELEREDV